MGRRLPEKILVIAAVLIAAPAPSTQAQDRPDITPRTLRESGPAAAAAKRPRSGPRFERPDAAAPRRETPDFKWNGFYGGGGAGGSGAR